MVKIIKLIYRDERKDTPLFCEISRINDMSSNKLEAEEKQEQLTQDLISKMDTSKFTVHKLTAEEALKQLKTDIKTGLSSAEAAKRLAEYGPNELDPEEEKTLWERIVEQFEDVLVQILLASAMISFVIALMGKLSAFRTESALSANHV